MQKTKDLERKLEKNASIFSFWFAQLQMALGPRLATLIASAPASMHNCRVYRIRLQIWLQLWISGKNIMESKDILNVKKTKTQKTKQNKRQ